MLAHIFIFAEYLKYNYILNWLFIFIILLFILFQYVVDCRLDETWHQFLDFGLSLQPVCDYQESRDIGLPKTTRLLRQQYRHLVTILRQNAVRFTGEFLPLNSP